MLVIAHALSSALSQAAFAAAIYLGGLTVCQEWTNVKLALKMEL